MPNTRTGTTSRAFKQRLAIIALAGLAVRLVYVLGFHRNYVVGGDPYAYHYGANLLVHGKGFVVPSIYNWLHHSVQAADHPPLYTLYLAIPSALGMGTVLVHLVWSALLGSATIVVVGFVGRRAAGERVGLIAAAVVAFAPNVWVYDGQLFSETMAIFVTTLAILLAFRALEKPTSARMCALGACCGLAALSRSELVLLIPLLLIPVAVRARGLTSWRVRALRFGAAALVALAVVSPWVGYNLSRFEHPVYLSSQLDATLAAANCGDTYKGPALGTYTSTCMAQHDMYVDESVAAELYRHHTQTFVSGHMSQLPLVMAARVGRVTGLFRPSQQLDLDVMLEGRERPLAIAGLVNTYLVEIGAVIGFVLLDPSRRRVPMFPLLVLPAITLITVAATYGTNRFRAPAETSVAILTAVAVNAAYTRVRAGLRHRAVRRTPVPGITGS